MLRRTLRNGNIEGDPASYQNLILGDGPWAYYRMDTNTFVGEAALTDWSGNGYHLNGPPISSGMTSATSLLAQNGGTCVNFPGTGGDYFSSYVLDVDEPNWTPHNNITMECWFNRTSESAAHSIFGYDSANGTGDEWTIRLLASTGGSRIQFEATIGGTRYSYNSGAGLVSTGTTYHLVITLDSSNVIQCWLNGVLRPIAGTPNVSVGGTRTVTIGSGGGFFDFPGKIDEVAFYNYVLTDLQIARHYAGGI